MENWHHIPGSLNPADDCTRKTSPLKLGESRWQHGPEFVVLGPAFWPTGVVRPIPFDDKEVKKVKVQSTKDIISVIDVLERCTNSWTKMVRIVFRILCWKKSYQRSSEVEVKLKAEKAIIRLVQQKAFPDDIIQLKKKQQLMKSSSIFQPHQLH